jgi:phosphatidylcholine synthase
VNTRSLPARQPSRSRLAAYLVHAYTAIGAVLAFIGTVAVAQNNPRRAFAMMFVATIVDATDGALARRARVKMVLPDVDGAHLDDIVDYLTFVFLPMLLIERTGGLPASAGLLVVAVVLIASVIGFSMHDAKTIDNFFTGFPSYWNIVVLYLYAAKTPPVFNAVLLLVLSALVFVRIGYIYPSRTTQFRSVTLALGALWAAEIAAMIWLLPAPPAWLLIVSLVFPVYYLVMSLLLHARRRVRST